MARVTSVLRSLFALLALTALAASCSVEVVIPAEQIALDSSTAPVFEANATYLAKIRERTDLATSLRFEVFMEIDSSFVSMGDRETVVMNGGINGTNSSTFVDFGSLMGPMMRQTGLGIDESALTMSMVTTEDFVYLNAPFFNEITSQMGFGTDSDLAWLQDLAIGWGRIDASKLSGNNDLLSQMSMGTNVSGTEMLAILDAVGPVLDGGTDEVRGVPTRVALAGVSFYDLINESGQDLGSLGLGSAEKELLQSLDANVTVHIDDDGLVRRLEFKMDFGALASVDPSMAGLDMSMWQRIDFFDFNQPVNVQIPANSFDITDDFEDLLDIAG